MNITNVSKKYNISVRTLRYYEELGIIKSSRLNNIRQYDDSEIEKIELILVLKELNLKLKDIKDILNTESYNLLKEILASELKNIKEEIAILTNKKLLLQSLLVTFGSNDITKHNIKAFINEQIYFSSKNERLMEMLINKENIVLELGRGLIPIAASQDTYSLLVKIKELRATMSKEHSIDFDKVRVRDNLSELQPYEYQILIHGKAIVKKNTNTENPESQIDHIITNLKAVLL